MHSPDGYREDPRDIIRRLRVERGFRSDRALAEAADMTQPTLARYLNGTSATLEVKHWVALANALDVTVSELLGEVPITPGFKRVVRAMERLSANDQDTVLELAQVLASKADRATSTRR